MAEKVANNWDIVCLAEEYEKGFDDYLRFQKSTSNSTVSEMTGR